MARHLITSALPYINGVKHLGNLVGSMLPADVHGRYLRLRGHDVLLICATDDHGTPAELAAHDAGQPVDVYCTEQHAIQSELSDRWNLSWDYFGRSSSAQNEEITLRVYHALDKAGLLVDRDMTQIYSKADGRFLPDRYVIGTCPHCAFERARGDQCENCTRVLDPEQLINPRSAISGSTDLETRTTRHLFLQLDKLSDRLRDWITHQVDWPVLTTSIALKWLNEGLRERCITRDLNWGFSVPREGYENKVFYVWFDAPIEYIGSTKEWADAKPGREWESWWTGDAANDVQYTQFMGKDNVPFHTIMWPGIIIGTGDPWKQANYIKSYSWLTYYGGKFSTSQGRGIFMDQALELLPADYWRWYLMANAPETDDVDFTWEAFGAEVNKALADTLGNFVSRCLKLNERQNPGVEGSSLVPAAGEWTDEERRLAEELDVRIATFNRNMDEVQFRKAAAELYLIWQAGNVYFQNAEPWKLIKESPERAAVVMRTSVNLIRVFAALAQPFIPESAERILAALGSGGQSLWFDETTPMTTELVALSGGHSIATPAVLFPKVTDDQIKDWAGRFAGTAAV